MNISVTVATVTYNAEKHIVRTLQSVAAQSFPFVEHLIIDGCSKDKTLNIVRKYVQDEVKKDIPHKIVVISESDKGLYDAMNKAILKATGNYIVFLNAGDALHSSNTLAELFSFVKDIKDIDALPAVIYGQTNIVNEKGTFIRGRRLQAPDELNWKSFRKGMLVCHQSFYVRTDVARKEPYNLSYQFSSDFDWCIRILKRIHNKKMRTFNSHLVLTDYLSEGMTTKNHRASLLERFRIMKNHYGLLATIVMHLWFCLRALIKK